MLKHRIAMTPAPPRSHPAITGVMVIKNTGRGYDWFGSCEECGKRCDLHYKQRLEELGGYSTKRFGHLECLKSGAFANATVDHNA